MTHRITITLTQSVEDDGWWVVASSDVPGLHTQGRTIAAALANAADAVRAMQADGSMLFDPPYEGE